ncbi:MAG: phosphoglucosamine mutase [Bacteroidales bacterium]|nr:phosphoglucosamine mutase [Bacteroidales bacterium]
MSLIKSISGIRGTIGGRPGEGLSPIDVVKFTTAFATFLKSQSCKDAASQSRRLKLAVGRDARLSGAMVDRLVVGTLQGMGVDVLETGLSTTPTTEMTVIDGHCDGGIIITASHNPKHWNALKLLNAKGEFISDAEGKEVLRLAESPDLQYAEVDDLGQVTVEEDWIDRHIERVLGLKLVDTEAIRKAGFKVAVDAVNSTGGLAIPRLLRRLGVEQVVELNCEPTGHFAHNPEPIPQNLTQISDCVRENHCDLGIVVDPDVDRLALVCETGEMFGEEYTLVSVADYVLSHTPGNTVSNLSSSRALRDVTRRYAGCEYNAAAVGEVNVTTLMRETHAVIGGEGNGGVIYPELHYGRDALVGVALFLTLLAKKGMKISELRKTYPEYIISKNRKDLTPEMDVDALLEKVASHYRECRQDAGGPTVTTIDGVKIDFADGWVHLRKSNTEPIIRIYSEAATEARAGELAQQVMQQI